MNAKRQNTGFLRPTGMILTSYVKLIQLINRGNIEIPIKSITKLWTITPSSIRFLLFQLGIFSNTSKLPLLALHKPIDLRTMQSRKQSKRSNLNLG